jgi:putative addiction module killer protein
MELEFENGIKPFRKWFSKLRDIDAKAQIRKRIRQAEEGNFGNYRHVGDGVFEFKIFEGPGVSDLLWN